MSLLQTIRQGAAERTKELEEVEKQQRIDDLVIERLQREMLTWQGNRSSENRAGSICCPFCVQLMSFSLCEDYEFKRCSQCKRDFCSGEAKKARPYHSLWAEPNRMEYMDCRCGGDNYRLSAHTSMTRWTWVCKCGGLLTITNVHPSACERCKSGKEFDGGTCKRLQEEPGYEISNCLMCGQAVRHQSPGKSLWRRMEKKHGPIHSLIILITTAALLLVWIILIAALHLKGAWDGNALVGVILVAGAISMVGGWFAAKIAAAWWGEAFRLWCQGRLGKWGGAGDKHVIPDVSAGDWCPVQESELDDCKARTQECDGRLERQGILN